MKSNVIVLDQSVTKESQPNFINESFENYLNNRNSDPFAGGSNFSGDDIEARNRFIMNKMEPIEQVSKTNSSALELSAEGQAR